MDLLLWERRAGKEDVYRMKGVLHVAGSKRQHTVQAVRETYDISQGPEWPREDEAYTKLVVIGKNLCQEQLQSRLQRCSVSQDPT